jgi:hypothetical protein
MKSISNEFDYLGVERPAYPPPFRNTEPRKTAAVLAVMKNEGPLILEWIAHYRMLGFDAIFIYTNDNDDGSDDLLAALDHAGIIHVTRHSVAPGTHIQLKAYRHAFWFDAALWEHEWVALLDADEFMIPLHGGDICDIGTFTSSLGDASAISLNWRWFPGSREFSRNRELLFERYREASWATHVKTMFRLRDAADVGIHLVGLAPGKFAINGDGLKREKSTNPHEKPPASRLGRINHYWNRSFEEFYLRRGRGDVAERRIRDWTSFFQWGHGGKVHDPHPNTAHVEAVKREIEHLRSLPSVRSAEEQIEGLLAERLNSPEVRETFESCLKPF